MCKHISDAPRLVGTRFQVLFHSPPGVLFTIPSRYYPLSVTREYLGLAGGPARFTRDFSGPVLLGCLSNEPLMFRLRGLTLYAGPFACPSPTSTVSDSSHSRQTVKERSHNPAYATLPGLTRIRFGLIQFRSPLLPESRLFSLPAGTEMFHFPAFPPLALCVQARVTAMTTAGFPIRKPPDQSLVDDSPGLSWPPTSFIGSWCQGIHRAPLKTWPQMLASTVQFSNNDQPPITPHRSTSSLGRHLKAA